jgi:CRISPR/Cas system-associated exonuclease Cas4 (RecB family)
MKKQPDHSSRGHAEFSPSSLKYVSKCAGFHGREGTNASAEMGTRIHEALEIFDPSALHNEQELEIYEKIVEMEKEFLSNFGGIAEEHNEIQVTVALNGTETWGTCDRFLILESGNAVMADYKTGISIIDPPEKNWQAKAYVVGAFQKFPDINEITFVFYVPQHNQSLYHTFSREADLDKLIDELSAAILKAENTRPKWIGGKPDLADLTPTPNCRFCRYEDICPALGGLVLEVARKIDPQIPDVDIENTEDPVVLEELWAVAKVVSNWSDRLRARTIELAKNGTEFPSLRLRSMGSTKKIVDNTAAISVAADFGLSIEDIIQEATFSVNKLAKAVAANAEKLEKKKISQDFVDACQNAGIIETSDTRFTLS